MKKLLFPLLALGGACCSLPAAESPKQEKETVLVVPCHPDDLVAAFGFCLLARDIYDIHVVEFTKGERGCGYQNFTNGMAAAARMAEEQAVCDDLGVTLHWMDAGDGTAHAGREVCDELSEYVLKYRPRALIGHYPVDIHGDHMMAGAAMLKAAFNVSTKDYKPEIYFFEQPYQTKAFHPDIFLDISEVFARKREIAGRYFSQGAGRREVARGITSLEEIPALREEVRKRREALEKLPRGAEEVNPSPNRTLCCNYFYGMHTSDLNTKARVEPFVAMFPRQQGQQTVFDRLPRNPRRFNSRFQGAKDGKWAEVK